MPDPYGIATLALTDYDGYILRLYGDYPDDSTLSQFYLGLVDDNSVPAGDYSISTGTTALYQVSGSSSKYSWCGAFDSTYCDVLTDADLSNSDYSSVTFSGGGSFRFYGGNTTATIYPTSCQLIVNDYPVGDVFTCTDGYFTLSDTEVVISTDVYNMGVRFFFDACSSGIYTASSATSTRTFRSVWTDNIVYSVTDKSEVYVPYFERVIAWEQSIYSAITALSNDLSDSLGGGIDRIASVFARDDDIQLRDDMDSTLQEVTMQFYDQTSTSSSSMTVETVQNVKGISDGMDAMFSSGYSVSDAFTEIAENDDFMSWFTSETAAALDATGQAAAVAGDDDPYNMHYYYDNLNEALGKRGND